MDAVEFMRKGFDRLHSTITDAVKDLTLEQINFRPDNQHYSIAWVLWHAVRTEDLVLRSLVQKQPEIWVEGRWHQRLDLPEKGQGTGQTPQEAQSIAINDMDSFMAYAREVWANTDSLLQSLSPEDLDRMYPWRRAASGEEPLGQIIGTHVMAHIYGHRNEIYWLRSLQGLQGSPY